MSKPKTPSSGTYSCASQRHFGWMPAAPPASRASAGNRGPGNQRHLRRGLPGHGPGGGGTAAREPRAGEARSARSLHTPPPRAPLPHHPRGSFIPARPQRAPGAPSPRGPGALALRPPRPPRSPLGLPTLRPGQAGPAARTRLLLPPPPPLGPHRQAVAAPRTDREEAVAALGPDCGGVL